MSEGKRVKRWAPKVFSGCQTCKRRRIKCDETKPGCQRCARSGLSCDGYQPPPTRMFDPTKKGSASASDPSPSPDSSGRSLSLQSSTARSTPSPIVPTLAFTTSEEQHAFDYFCRHTSLLISVYSHQPFWCAVLPQAAQKHLAVKHSVLTLAILHRSLVKDGFLSDENHESLSYHRSQAIRAITQGQPSVEVVLMTCILFWAIDSCLSKSGADPSGHVEAAIKILDEFKYKEENRLSSHWDLIVEDIEPVLKIIQVHIERNLLDASNVLPLEALGNNFNNTYAQVSPTTSITNLEEAVVHLGNCLRQIFRLMHGTSTVAKPTQIKADVATIELHLARLLGVLPRCFISPLNPTHWRLFIIHHTVAFGLCRALSKRVGGQEVGPDPDAGTEESMVKTIARWITNEIKEILDTSSAMADNNINSNNPQNPGGASSSTSICLASLGFIPPLFASAILCDDLVIRARALALLRRLARVEGQWTSHAAAKTVEVIIAMKEDSKSSSTHNIPNNFELHDLTFGIQDHELTLSNSRTGTSVPCRIWKMLKGFEEVDLDVLTSMVHNYGYEIENTPPNPSSSNPHYQHSS